MIPFWKSYWFQDSNSSNTEFLYLFYDKTMMLMIIIIVNLFILYVIFMKTKFFVFNFPESAGLEDMWLMIPLALLLFIGLPSIKNLYMNEEFNQCDMNFKITGHQWYWSYEYINSNYELDSFMKTDNYSFRLLETFNHLIVPMKCVLRFLVSSEDVIHSWAIPSLGIKMDATPGRISQSLNLVNRPGVIFGQCSEICGSNHSFMPIMIYSLSMKNF